MLDIEGLILDGDGVLWRGSEPLPGLAAFLETLEQRGIPFVIATNNSTRTRQQYAQTLAEMTGAEVRADQVITSADATADYLTTIAPPGASVYVIGEAGLEAALASRGFRLTSDGAAFVVAGLDRDYSYRKMAIAMELIGKGAAFIGTNPDRTLPTPEGPRPGAGAVLSSIAAASGVEPLIVGKPEPIIFHQALARLGTRPERTAMVGDRLETDILGGNNSGIKTVLVLSGVTSPGQLAQSPIAPTWVLDDIRALAAALDN